MISCRFCLFVAKIHHVFSNMSLLLKKSYNQRVHLCYVHIGLRFTTYEYIPPLLALRSLFRKSYLLVKRSQLLRVHIFLRLRLTTISETVAGLCLFQTRVMRTKFDFCDHYCNESVLYTWSRYYVKGLLPVSVVNGAVNRFTPPLIVCLSLAMTCISNVPCRVHSQFINLR